jgi:uracil-DNA glycosylase
MAKINIISTPTEEMSIVEVVECGMPKSWQPTFAELEEDIKAISRTIESDEKKNGKIYPLRKDIFRSYYLTPLERVRVVIFGQDPYIQIGTDGLPRPTGLAFSVRNTDSTPRSLQMVFTELSNTVSDFRYPLKGGDLTPWTKQGVFLLNTSLTVNPNVGSGSHGDMLWRAVISKTIETISKYNPDTIWMLWGGDAKSLSKYIRNKKFILEAAHPVARNGGFLGCNHFNKANDILEKLGEPKIDWNIDTE